MFGFSNMFIFSWYRIGLTVGLDFSMIEFLSMVVNNIDIGYAFNFVLAIPRIRDLFF